LKRLELSVSASHRTRLRKRQEGVSEEIKEIAWKAQVRLSKRYARLAAAARTSARSSTAVTRNYWASSGPSDQGGSGQRTSDGGVRRARQKQRQKQKLSKE